MTDLKKCPCGQIPKHLFIHMVADEYEYAYAYGDCCDDWEIPFRTVNGSPYSDLSYAEAVKAWNEAPRESGWISVKDRLPDKLALSGQYEDYLVTRNGHVLIAHWTSGGKFLQSFSCEAPIAVDFWMPLPDPPKED